MMMHPGKKLNFMGSEFGQLREWDEARSQDWEILKYPKHDAFRHYIRALNYYYVTLDAFYKDYDFSNFKWLDCHQEERRIYVMCRYGSSKQVVALFNFSDEWQKDYSLNIGKKVQGKMLLNTDWQCYDGNVPQDEHISFGQDRIKNSVLTIDLPPYSGMLLELETLPKQKKLAKFTKKK